jgi:hypothetical protein
MPTRIHFASSKFEVAESPEQVSTRLNENAGLPVRFDAHEGDGTKVVYVNPGQVTYFEEMPPFEDRAPLVSVS